MTKNFSVGQKIQNLNSKPQDCIYEKGEYQSTLQNIMHYLRCEMLHPVNVLHDHDFSLLTHKSLETHGCVISTMATVALMLKHQAISIHSAD